jgi:single-strand DNA-binding protein
MGLPSIHGEFGVCMDPEIRFSQAGKCWMTLRLVSKKRERDSNGVWQDGTALFIDAVVFNADNLADSISKGDQIVIDGTLEQQEWNDKETGEKRSKVRIVVENVGVSTRWNKVEVIRTERAAKSDSNTDEGDPSDMPF